MTRTNRLAVAVLALSICAAASGQAMAWSYHGHVLITRAAALRLIDDPSTPAGLRTFLSATTTVGPNTLRAMAVEEVSDFSRDDPPPVEKTLEFWSVEPDRARNRPDGRAPIAPYGVDESKMHYLDLEYLGPVGVYKDDGSGLPPRSSIPRDVTDPRYTRAGFLPFRVAEAYGRLVSELAKDDPEANMEAVKWAGYMAHYIQDAHQPHHGTEDFKSLSYLAGQVPGVPAAAAAPGTGPLVAPRVDRSINPHNDMEGRIFSSRDGEYAGVRGRFWQRLSEGLNAPATRPATTEAAAPAGEAGHRVEARIDPYEFTLDALYSGYAHLPHIGRAARAAYATGAFDAAVWFGFADPQRPDFTITDLIAQRKAMAAGATERLLRQAWEDAQIRRSSQRPTP